jgi:hypothetical protein
MSSNVQTVQGFQYSNLGYPITDGGKKKRKTTRRRRSMRGGVSGLESTSLSNASPVMAESQRNSIPLNTIATPDWTNPNQPRGPPPYAAEASVGWNEYQFGRTTPDNKFIVATGLVEKPGSLEMIGAGKKKKSKSTVKKVTNTVGKAGKVVFNKTKSVITTVGDVVIKTVQYVGKKTSNTVKSLSSSKKKSTTKKTKNSKKSKKSSRK